MALTLWGPIEIIIAIILTSTDDIFLDLVCPKTPRIRDGILPYFVLSLSPHSALQICSSLLQRQGTISCPLTLCPQPYDFSWSNGMQEDMMQAEAWDVPSGLVLLYCSSVFLLQWEECGPMNQLVQGGWEGQRQIWTLPAVWSRTQLWST